MEPNRCQAYRLRSREGIGGWLCVCHGSLTATLAHPCRWADIAEQSRSTQAWHCFSIHHLSGATADTKVISAEDQFASWRRRVAESGNCLGTPAIPNMTLNSVADAPWQCGARSLVAVRSHTHHDMAQQTGSSEPSGSVSVPSQASAARGRWVVRHYFTPCNPIPSKSRRLKKFRRV